VHPIGQELGVNACSGNIQSGSGAEVQVTAQLIDASTGGHLWAKNADQPEADLVGSGRLGGR